MRNALIPSLLVLALLNLSCSEEGDADARTPNACDSFSLSASIVDTMRQPAAVFNTGEDMSFLLKISNRSNETLTLSTGASCYAARYEVENAPGQRVWSSAENGIVCAIAAPPRLYAPYEEVVWEVRWNQNDANRTQVAPGNYLVRATPGQNVTDSAGKVSTCRPEFSKSVPFTIL